MPLHDLEKALKYMALEGRSVIGIVAAYRRTEMLRALLESVRDSNLLRVVIVVDNGFQQEVADVCRASATPVRYHRPEQNLGCGGGVARGLELGLKEEKVTHFCFFDDDAQAIPGAVDSLVQGMKAVSASIAVPLVLNSQGYVSWYPGLRDRQAFRVIRRQGLTAEEYRRLCGANPVSFSWSPWPVMAVSAEAVKENGFPRDDFFLCAEDIEYSLRLTYRNLGVLVPNAVCRHLPPASSGGDEPGGAHYLRFCLLLQNLSYIGTRLPHGRRALRHLPTNYARFFRIFGVSHLTVRDAWLAWWRGLMRGKPAGVAGCDGFRQRFLSHLQERTPGSPDSLNSTTNEH
jgi:GT2 family glycosyltransferase